MKRVLLYLMSVLAASFSLVVVFAGSAAAADINGCDAALDNPHLSTGSGGVIVKGRYWCSLPETAVEPNLSLFNSVVSSIRSRMNRGFSKTAT